VRKKLKGSARHTGSRGSDLIRLAVERQLETQEPAVTAYDIALKNGVIDVVGNAPEDLSTNKAHFDGFGLS
jgi:hypothetical protein